MIGDGRLQLTELTPGSQTWLAAINANMQQVNDTNSARMKGIAGEALTSRQMVAIETDGFLYRADANSGSPRKINAMGMILSDLAVSEEGILVVRGLVAVPSHGNTPGVLLYLSDTAGAVTVTPPTSARIVGRVVDSDTYWIDAPIGWSTS